MSTRSTSRPTGRAKSVMLRVRGTAIGIETARGQPADALPRALERTRTTNATPGREVA
jgi:hypothetical protein